MQEWDKNSDKVSKITPDQEKARALTQVVELREKDLLTKNEEFVTLIIEGYSEIIKELITGIMAVDGYKTVSHELLVSYAAKFCLDLSTAEIYLIDQLRKTRNDIDYRGLMVPLEYLRRNKGAILKIIPKLKMILNKKLLP